MNRSKVMQQWLATPDNKTTDIRYPLAIDSGFERITGNNTPPSKMSDTASDIRNLLVYVWRDFLVMTRRKMVTLVSTINTDKIAIKVSTTEFSAIVLTRAATHDLISWWLLLIVYPDFFSLWHHPTSTMSGRQYQHLPLREQLFSLHTICLQTLWGTVSAVRLSSEWFIYVIYIDFCWFIAVLTIVIITQSGPFLIRQSNLHLNHVVKFHFSANEIASKAAFYLIRFYLYHEFFITFRGSWKLWTAKTNST